jgi:hypothetical protein
MQMNLQLHHVVSDITGATGMRIIRAVLAGERDPATLAALRDQRVKASEETVRQALVGNDREEHVFALLQAVELYDAYQAKVAACDVRIEAALKEIEAACPPPVSPISAPRHRTKQPNALAFPAREARRCLGARRAAGDDDRSIRRTSEPGTRNGRSRPLDCCGLVRGTYLGQRSSCRVKGRTHDRNRTVCQIQQQSPCIQGAVHTCASGRTSLRAATASCCRTASTVYPSLRRGA